MNPNPGGVRPLGRAAHRRVDGQGGQGPHPGAERDGPEGPDRQSEEVRLADPYDLGQEFYRWEFATAVAGAIIGINPFDQPNVQEAKDRTKAILDVRRGAAASSRSARSTSSSSRRGRRLLLRAGLRASRRRRPSAASRRSASACARETGIVDDGRLRAALPALDRPAPQGRPAERALPPGRRRAGGARHPRRPFGFAAAHPRAGRRRLRRAARATDAASARVRWEEHRMKLGDGRPRPHGRQHGQAPGAGRPRARHRTRAHGGGHGVARSRSSSASSRRRASSGS